MIYRETRIVRLNIINNYVEVNNKNNKIYKIRINECDILDRASGLEIMCSRNDTGGSGMMLKTR